MQDLFTQLQSKGKDEQAKSLQQASSPHNQSCTDRNDSTAVGTQVQDIFTDITDSNKQPVQQEACQNKCIPENGEASCENNSPQNGGQACIMSAECEYQPTDSVGGLPSPRSAEVQGNNCNQSQPASSEDSLSQNFGAAVTDAVSNKSLGQHLPSQEAKLPFHQVHNNQSAGHVQIPCPSQGAVALRTTERTTTANTEAPICTAATAPPKDVDTQEAEAAEGLETASISSPRDIGDCATQNPQCAALENDKQNSGQLPPVCEDEDLTESTPGVGTLRELDTSDDDTQVQSERLDNAVQDYPGPNACLKDQEPLEPLDQAKSAAEGDAHHSKVSPKGSVLAAVSQEKIFELQQEERKLQLEEAALKMVAIEKLKRFKIRLSLGDFTKNVAGSKKHRKGFSVVSIGYMHAHLLDKKSGLDQVLKPGCQVLVETPKYSAHMKKEEVGDPFY